MFKPENTFVVSLARARPKRQSFVDSVVEFANATLVDGVDGRELAVRESHAGAAGCLASHLKIYQHCIERSIESAVIFEDDVMLGPKSAEQISDKRDLADFSNFTINAYKNRKRLKSSCTAAYRIDSRMMKIALDSIDKVAGHFPRLHADKYLSWLIACHKPTILIHPILKSQSIPRKMGLVNWSLGGKAATSDELQSIRDSLTGPLSENKNSPAVNASLSLPEGYRRNYCARQIMPQGSYIPGYQDAVYAEAKKLGSRFVDIGCGRLQKLPIEMDVIGVDLPCIEEYAKENGYEFQPCDLEASVPSFDASGRVVIIADVIEHLENPRLILEWLGNLPNETRIVISTPDRRFLNKTGPPRNDHHVQEWTEDELSSLLQSCGITGGALKHVSSRFDGPKKTLMFFR